MSRSLPLHTYADIPDVEMIHPPLYPPSEPRRYMKIQQRMHAKGLGGRAVNRLPFEILREIFELYFDSSPVVYKLDGPLEPGIYNNISQQLNPFVLTQVCTYWRAVMFSIPSFWSSICIVGPLYKQSYAVKSWLSRAQRASVQLIQLDVRCAPHELEEATEEVLSALIQYSSRWQDLHLEFRCTEFQDALFKLDPLQLQCLEDVYIEFPPWAAQRAALNRVWSVIYQAPCLSRVAWNTLNIPPPLALHAWNQLTSVECEGSITQSDLWSLLKASPKLRRLLARGISIKDPLHPDALSPITHNTLEILDVEFKSSPILFYRNLVLPRLTTLRVARASLSHGERPATVAFALSKLLRWSSSSSGLESLTILDQTMPDDLLIGIFHLKELQNLKHLGIDCASNEIIAALRFASPPRPSILPRLLRLDIHTRYMGVATNTNVYDQMEFVRPSLRKLCRSRPASFKVSLRYLGKVIHSNNVY